MYILYSFVLDFLNASNYPIIDSVLDESNTYLELFTLGFILPMIFWLLFYKLYTYPYAKIFHWVIAYLVSWIIVFGCSFSIVNTSLVGSSNDILNDLLASDQTAIEIVDSMPIYIGIINAFYTALIGFCFSVFIKRFSKIQMHLPF